VSLGSALWRELRGRTSANQVRYAAGLAGAALVAYALSQALHLAGSYWSVLSAVIVYRFDFGTSLGASRDRLLGTAAGAALAAAFLFLARLWSLPDFLLLAAIIIPLSFLSAVKPQYRTALITSIIVLSAGGSATPHAAAIGRVLAVGLGAFIGGLSSFLLSLVKPSETGREPAARILTGLGSLLPLAHRPDDGERAARLRRDLHGGLYRYASAVRLRLPGAEPVLRMLTLIYWDVVFIGRVAPAAPDPEDKTGLQACLAQAAMSFQQLCLLTAESLRQARPLPMLLDFDKACGRLAGPGEEPTIVSLLRLLRRDFESLLLTLAELPGRGGIQPSR